ncbi:MAG: hypothetical protein A2277_19880 [Desulfobacterales bacterium RIFOXYA12_FULL_46_15]|nr:MAG: hypothetical protein A2277_19880 [Desulfobacterales bacterium RIFOXYA12_FULL_46_15]
MTFYFFRAEAVNMTPTVYDTSDISTIRGAGFYLLDRIHTLSRDPEFHDGLITEGASAAVFQFDTDAPKDIRKKMLALLYSDLEKKDRSGNSLKNPAIQGMTFLVEFMEHKSTFQKTMAALQGKIRVSQMQNPTIRIFPETLISSGQSEEGKDLTFDALNRVLPAHETDGNKGALSRFTKIRRDQGIKLRKKIYGDLLKGHDIPEKELNFTNDLETLSRGQGNLNGKIAYIYIDGNKFGKLQSALDQEALKEFDTVLDDFKKKFLACLIQYAIKTPAFRAPGKYNDLIRLETLLWGGDEIKLIVPAWLGWTVATLFFKTASDLSLGFQDQGLTFAMGMVLAHHTNPIQNLDDMAGLLVDAVKDGIKAGSPNDHPQYDRARGDRMHYAVLESLETLPQKDFQRFTEKQYQTSSRDMALNLETMKALQNFIRILKAAGFSRSRIHKIATAWLKEKNKGEAFEYKESLQRGLDLCQADEDLKTDLYHHISNITGTGINETGISSLIPERGFRWLQIAELWDYLVWEEEQNG